MAAPLNITMYGRDLSDAHRRVLDPTSSIDWVLAGYLGRDTLKVSKMGSGLDDLTDEFSSGKIQYAFARVKDQTTNLPKFVYIGWCGEGVPDKGIFTVHNAEVMRLFSGAHVTINARNDDDVLPSLIMKKVRDASGAKYSIHNEVAKPELPPEPVSSVYQKTVVEIPKREPERAPAPVTSSYKPVSASIPAPKPISTSKFGPTTTSAKPADERPKWEPPARAAPTEARASTGDEARRARDAELEALRNARTSVDDVSTSAPKDDRAVREAELAAIRSQRSTEYIAPSTNVVSDKASREAELAAIRAQRSTDYIPTTPSSATAEKAQRDAELAAMSRARQEAADREAEEEQRRRDEARAGYGRPAPPSAPVPAPAPVPTRAPVAPPPSRPSAFEEDRRRADEARRAEEERRAEEDRRAREREEADRRAQDEERRRADERREAEERDRVRREREAREAEERDRARREAEDRERARKEAEEQERARAAAAAAASAAAAPPAPKASSGVRAKAVYDYDKAEDNEISFSDGEIITDIEKVDEGWWKGRNAAGEVGLFPSTYVEEIHEAAPRAPAAVPAPPPPAPAPAPVPARRQTLTATAIYDYEAQESNEVGFAEGETITDIEKIDEGWWKGRNARGEEGLFPANYVELN